MRLMCLGLGYTARAFVARHGGRFSAISATARSAENVQRLGAAGVHAIDMHDRAAFDAAIAVADVILVSAGPTAEGDPFAALVGEALDGGTGPKHILYLSTIGVYGNHDGGWVDEQTLPRPVSPRSHWRLQAEADWLALGQHGVSVQVFRLGGIYGPGRSPLENVRQGKARRLVKPGQVFNRIHVDDIADVLAAAIDRGHNGAIWNVTDNEPAPPQDVVAFAAECLGVAPPPEQPFEATELTPMARSFYGENKRVSNAAIRRLLAAPLNYPTYREGIAALAGAAPR